MLKDLIPKDGKGVPVKKSDIRSPFGELHQRVNQLFDHFFDRFYEFSLFPARLEEGLMTLSPRFDVAENGNAFEITAELPGMDEKDVEVVLDDYGLTIKGEKKQEKEEKKKDYYLSERSYGKFQRTFPLSQLGIDKENIKASFKKGVLKIIVPKTEEAKTRVKRINITGE